MTEAKQRTYQKHPGNSMSESMSDSWSWTKSLLTDQLTQATLVYTLKKLLSARHGGSHL